MHVVLAARLRAGQEQTVVVHGIAAAVHVCEHRDFEAFGGLRSRVRRGQIEDVRGDDVEMSCVPVHLLLEFVNYQSVVPEFVDFGGAFDEALELPLAWFVDFVVDDELGLWCAGGGFVVGLAVDEVDGEAFGVVDGQDLAAARGVGHFFDALADDLDIRDLCYSGRV